MTIRVGVDAWGLSGPARHTGMGQYTEHLLCRLPGAGVEVVAYGAPGEHRPDRIPADVAWRSGPRRAPGRWAALGSRLTMTAMTDRDGIEVFHAPGVHVRPSLPPVPRVGCPLVVTVHDLIPITLYGPSLPARNRAFVRWNLARAISADSVITVSEASRGDLSAVLGLDADRVEVIPNVVHFARRRDAGALARLGVGAPFVLAAGSFEPRKNLPAVLVAFDRVAAQHPTLVLVAVVDAGSGHEAAVMAAVGTLEHADRVRFVRSVAEEDLEVLYTEAAAVVFCSLAEGFGFPAAQADACGTPLVASDLPVIREVVGDRACFVDPRSVPSIADGIERAIRQVPDQSDSCPRPTSIAATDWANAHADHYRRLVRSRSVARA